MAMPFRNNKERQEYYKKKASERIDTNANRPDEMGRIKVGYEERKNPLTKKPMHVIYIYNISPEDVNEIKETMNKNPKYFSPIVSIPRARLVDKDAVEIVIDDENLDNWMVKGFKHLRFILAKSDSNYDIDEVDNLRGQIENSAVSTNKKHEIFQNARNTAIDTWAKYIENINDPKTQELLKMYARIGVDKEYGHILSIKNVALIRAIDSDATFVAPPKKWLEFNRYVVPGARKFIVYCPDDREGRKFDFNRVQSVIDRMGWKGCAYTDLPIQVQTQVDIKCHQLGIGTYWPCTEFDVKDTRVIPGKEDLFTTQAGLLNNLTGEINDVAKEKEGENSGFKPDEVMEKRTEQALQIMTNYCNELGIKPEPSKTISGQLANALIAYYYAKAEDSANIDKDTNKMTFARNATHFTLIFMHLAWNELGRFAHSAEYTRKEVAEMMNAVHNLIYYLETNMNQMVNEDVSNILNRDEFKREFFNFCRKYGIKMV